MSKATKRKHVVKEMQELCVPTESQSIVRVLESRGNNLHEVETASGEQYLVSMPVKFRKNVWIKRGNYVLIEPIAEGDKVKAEIVKILTREHIKWYRVQNCWPTKFDVIANTPEEKKRETTGAREEDDDLFVNTNRVAASRRIECSDSDTNSEESDS